MSVTVIVGTQWGDEGKGKITNLLAREADIVARYNGGHNAGHSVRTDKYVFAFRLVPSGILYPHVTCLIGNGVIIDPRTLIDEIEELAKLGVEVSPARLKVSNRAHLVMPYDVVLDRAIERSLDVRKIGTTKLGIGPTFADKAARVGLRAGDMVDKKFFAEKVYAAVRDRNAVLEHVYNELPLDPAQVVQEYTDFAARLSPYVADTSIIIDEALRDDKYVICEGAQGTLLDVDHGTYPFVTSSSCVTGGALMGLGFGPKHVQRVIGVVKAFQVRVGEGGMPTELTDEVGDLLRGTGDQPWDEYGTVTGRERRCGWVDGVTVRYASRVNGLTEIAITKLDILSSFETIRVCVAYNYRGKRLEHFPAIAEILAECEPIYEEFPGWKKDIHGVRQFKDLPSQARDYVRFIEYLAEVPAAIISVGPEQKETIIV